MRTKIALLFGVMALVAASAAPAAQGKIVTLKENASPLAVGTTFQAYSSNLSVETVWGYIGCTWGNPLSGTPKAGDLTTKVVKNKADPAVLSGFSGVVPCSVNGEPPLSGTSEATGPIELYGDGTGKLPIKFSLVYHDPKNPCVYTAVLNLVPLAGSSNAHFYGSGSGTSCGPAVFTGDLEFRMRNGTPVTFNYS